MFNPYARNGHSLETPARHLVLVTPNNDEEFERAAKSLRIWNPADAVATVHLVTISGGDVTITVPPGLTIEPIITGKVFATGTTGGLIIHAYTD